MANLNAIIQSIKNVVEDGKFKPIKLLPASLLLCTSLKRPGMSAMDIFAARTQAMAANGFNVNANPDGSANLDNIHDYLLITSIVDNIKMKGSVQIVMDTGSISVKGVATSGGVNIPVIAINDKPAIGTGIVG